MAIDRKKEYSIYIRSSRWKKIKEEILVNAGWKCELCESRKNLVVHHTKYPKIFGEETPDMLQCLCEECHNIKCHNGSAPKSKIRLTKQQKRQKNRSRKKALFAGPIKIYTKKEIDNFALLWGA